MQIEKKFLNVAPVQTEAKIESVLEVTVKHQGEKIKDLEERLEKAEAAITFLAGFEKTITEAIEEEVDLLDNAAKTTKNTNQEFIFKNLLSSFNRINERIMYGHKFVVNTEKMSIDRIVKDE